MNDEEVLSGGAVNQVSRRGNVVYRSGGVWVPTIHAVLAHLREAGMSLVPEPLGVADDGREMISLLPGRSMQRESWEPVMFTHHALHQAAAIVRQLHDTTADLTFPEGTPWRSGESAKTREQIVRHGDLGPWNFLWEGSQITGLIDWDFAEPGDRLTDVAQLALYFVPLRGEAHARECGFSSVADLPARLETICATYGQFTVAEVLGEIERLQLSAMREIEERASQGRYPWTMFRDNGEIERTAEEVAWLRRTFPDIFPVTAG